MSRFLVSADCLGRAIHLDEYESGRVFDLLDDIKSRDAGLAKARGRIGHRCLFEGIEAFKFNVNLDVDDEHGERANLFSLDLRAGEMIGRVLGDMASARGQLGLTDVNQKNKSGDDLSARIADLPGKRWLLTQGDRRSPPFS